MTWWAVVGTFRHEVDRRNRSRLVDEAGRRESRRANIRGGEDMVTHNDGFLDKNGGDIAIKSRKSASVQDHFIQTLTMSFGLAQLLKVNKKQSTGNDG